MEMLRKGGKICTERHLRNISKTNWVVIISRTSHRFIRGNGEKRKVKLKHEMGNGKKIITSRQRTCGKVMLLAMSVCHSVHGGPMWLLPGFPLDLENLEKWEYAWKTWKYHGILKNLINIMEKWHETWKNLVVTKNSPVTPLKQYKIH